MKWPPPTVVPRMGGSHIDSQQFVRPLIHSMRKWVCNSATSPLRNKELPQPSLATFQQHSFSKQRPLEGRMCHKIGRKLAYFGGDALMQSTLTVFALDGKMQAMLQDIRHVACYSITKAEFNEI